ncbi:hypothetical protein BCR34DRAFT_606028 [Clohesyomyces aquaticus]|uniref:Uncharacterized protein n=1 Tax=Clohesyomyces aquaticus TaxID=1231657 RepID=A0A1Y1YT87_9PLEO|nr:hypothetical protein BCR34DRAFT_606028 [Clohesyomyces aquaticus]
MLMGPLSPRTYRGGVTNVVRNMGSGGHTVDDQGAPWEVEFDLVEPDDNDPYAEGLEDDDLGKEAWHNLDT